MNLTKYVQDLYEETTQLMSKIKGELNTGERFQVCGQENSVLSAVISSQFDL